MKTAGHVRRSAFPTTLSALLGLSLFFAGESRGQTQTYPETTWVRVIFYDYHSSIGPYTPTVPDGANAGDTDFTFGPGQQCVASTPNNVVPGMVQDTLSPDRKLIPAVGVIPILGTYTYCTEPEGDPPCACHMVDWYRVSASTNTRNYNWYDTNYVFACDSGQPNPLPGNPFPGIRTGTPKNPVWYWALKNGGGGLIKWKGRTGEYIGQGWDSTNPYANVIVYDSIPFTRVGPATSATYTFTANAASVATPGSHFPYDNGGFFPLDGRGFGRNYGTDSIWDEPDFYAATATDKATNNHNFGYAMDMHIKFQFEPGLTFTFTGDDDLWCFINGKLAVDLGGVKAAATTSVGLDSMAARLGLTAGNYYTFDLFYNERNPTGADIQITTNLFLVKPTYISLNGSMYGAPLHDTLIAGDTTAQIVGQVLDQNGQRIPLASDSIQWTEVFPLTPPPGDQILEPNGMNLPGPPNNRDTAIKFTATEALRTADIVATYFPAGGTAFSCTTFVYVRPNRSVVLYDSTGTPSATIVPLPNPATAITVIAGRPFLMDAKMFDAIYPPPYYVYDPLYETDSAAYNQYFTWSAANPEAVSLNGYLNPGKAGVTQYFTDTVSLDSAYVIVRVQLPVTYGLTLKDTVLLHVVPNIPTHMVIENSPVPSQHIPPKPPWDTLFIPSTSDTGYVYAVLRDRYQNLVGFDTTITSVVALDTLGILDSSVINVSLGNQHTGQVIVTRDTAASGTAWVVVTDANGFSDTCVVVSLTYGYKALRIVAGNNMGPHSQVPLVVTTDQDSTIYVQAQRTDNLLWVSIAAAWQLSPGLAGLTPPPTPGQLSSSFSVAPTDTGSGWISVSLGNVSITAPDTMQVHLTAGGPVQAVIQIITPASQRVAGQPIKGVVVLQDVHGNTVDIPTTVFTTASGGGAYYADTLGSGGKPAPFLIADGDTVMLDHISPDSCSETFTNGVDTIYFTLYNAPPDSDFIVIPHQISVSLKAGGTATPITGVSPPFKLYPGPIAGLQIQTADGTPIHMDTLNNATKPFNTYFSRGYDQYGNLFGTMNSNWHVTGSLHAPIVDTIGQGSIYYNATADSESGYLVAIYDTAYSDSSVHAYSDSVYIIIKPSSATLVTAITRDWDGTGYLDHFDLIFSRKVQLPTDSASIAAFAAAVKITSPDPSTTISVKGIVFPILPADSIWTVTLNNNHPDSVLQTGWKPDVTMLSFPQADIGATPAIIAQDGAGPVIARAVKQKFSIAGNTHDQVTVTFSEQLRFLPQNSAPSAFLDVWVKDSAGHYIKDSTLLSGIPGPLAPATNDTQAVFFMTNDSNITLGHYYVSIDSASSWTNVQLCDLYGNRPDSNNRKVLVTFNSSVSGPLVISPNPMRRPGTVNGSPHLVIQDNSNNISDPVSNHGGGVKMTFDVPVPNTGDTGITVQAAVAIYDIVGNLVIAGQNSRFIYYNGSQWILDNGSGGESIADLVGTGTIVRPSIYWSGENGRGMTVAPGVYRGVVALHYAGRGTASYGDQHSSANIGVMHAAR